MSFKYRGVVIHHSEDGYWASVGGACGDLGYCDDVRDLKAEIDDYFDDDGYGGNEKPLDTPCLDTSFHDHEMDA